MSEETPFPWAIGVHDAHCHPTDTEASITSIPQMKATTLTIMSTNNENQDLVAQTAISFSAKNTNSTNDRVVPSFGWHPWYAHLLIDDTAHDMTQSPAARRAAHYAAVLAVSPGKENQALIDALPDPKPLSEFITETRARLQQFPHALVGEVGLDKAFRIPMPQTAVENGGDGQDPPARRGLSAYRTAMDHQRTVLKAQLQLAAELKRPVSLHSVQCHGTALQLLREMWAGYEKAVPTRRERRQQRDAPGALSDEEVSGDGKTGIEAQSDVTGYSKLPFPPRVCVHSYCGNVGPVREFMNAAHPCDFYFSFSKVINMKEGATNVTEVIKYVPEDRILLESDYHTAGPEIDEMLETAAREICTLRGWELEEGVKRFADNWQRFVYG
ncbi:TatD family [Penicillium bovifimosum]|uniref:TatD family n=1 Tax=Penicillium bovifimosum TaxID=126998 RepID=A0A9W9H9X0_9EURO|nr:TatD family [Penicillium bovifimosum]KAJ5142782.1 TatD family [Penicillium bovifimosum]